MKPFEIAARWKDQIPATTAPFEVPKPQDSQKKQSASGKLHR